MGLRRSWVYRLSAAKEEINKHSKNVYRSSELEENSVVSILEHTAEDENNTKQNIKYFASLYLRDFALKN